MSGKSVKETDVAELAHFLEVRKSNDHSCTLFLGSRAGGLFRSRRFYETLKAYSRRNFKALSQAEQFAECYKILDSGQFSETDLHILLKISLEGLDISEGDICLAEMVQSGFFSTIITTNIDRTLEQALMAIGIRELQDFEIFVPERDILYKTYSTEKQYLIKTFGDLTSRVYNVMQRHSYLDNHKLLRNLLENNLAQDVIVVGFDPVWDGELLHAFMTQERNLWIVSEEPFSSQHPFATLAKLYSVKWQETQIKYMTGKVGGYEHFMKALHFQLYLRPPLTGKTTNALQSLKSTISQLRIMIEEIEDQQINQISPYFIDSGPLTVETQETSSTDQ